MIPCPSFDKEKVAVEVMIISINSHHKYDYLCT